MMQVILSHEQLDHLAALIAGKLQTRTRREPYTVDEAARALGVCAATVRRHIQAGIIPSVPHISKRLVPASVIESMLGNQTLTTAAR
jgi:excisionase family DNA binding protein